MSDYDSWKLGLTDDDDQPDCLNCGDSGCCECEPEEQDEVKVVGKVWMPVGVPPTE